MNRSKIGGKLLEEDEDFEEAFLGSFNAIFRMQQGHAVSIAPRDTSGCQTSQSEGTGILKMPLQVATHIPKAPIKTVGLVVCWNKVRATLSWEQHNFFHLSTQSRKPLLKSALHVNHCLECKQETSLWPSFVQLSRPYLWPGKSGAQGQHPVILQESVLPVLSLDIGDDMKPPVPNTMKPSGQGSTNRAAQQVCSSLQSQKSRTMAMSPSQTSQLLPGPSFTSKCSSR